MMPTRRTASCIFKYEHPGQAVFESHARMSVPLHLRPMILCVDEEETGLEIRKQMLEKSGYRVLTAVGAAQALEVFRENHIDLVLTENIMAARNGRRTLAAAMKILKPEVSLAIYSADVAASPEDMRFADIFITKLAPIGELLRTIEKLLAPGPIRAAA
jgi:CheY-like chemotaxis protein